MNTTAVLLFAAFVTVTLAITAYAGRRTKTTNAFYAAEGQLGGFVNGLAISGDFISAATFLGITGLVFAAGLDTMFYILTPFTGLAILLFVVAGPFRRLGRFTLSDVAAYRLREAPVRIFAATGSLVVVILYLVVQFIGLGKLVQALFQIDYTYAVTAAGLLTIAYVGIGGMIATTWVQLIKAILMIAVIVYISVVVLQSADFRLVGFYEKVAAASPHGAGLFGPGLLFTDPVSLLSFALAMPLGLAGLPHVLMRLFTVPDARQAHLSVFYATFFIGLVQVLVFFVIGMGAVFLLAPHPEFFDADGRVLGGTNMVAIHLSQVLGGDVFFGVVSAVIFATILAVVCGLILAGASAVSHDLYSRVFRAGKAKESEEVLATRIATVALGICAILLAIVFEDQNIAYMVSLVFAVSASANFPVLILSLYWRGLTTWGAVLGGTVGLVSAVALIAVGPTVWVEVFGNDTPLFPYKYPGIVSIPAAFLSIFFISRYDRSEQGKRDRLRFDEQARVAFG